MNPDGTGLSRGERNAIVVLFLAVGIAFLAIGLGMGIESLTALNGWKRTEGVVVALNPANPGARADELAWLRTVEFRDGRGTLVRFTDSAGSTPLKLGNGRLGIRLRDAQAQPGARVTVYYPPAHPEKARIGSFSSMALIPLALTAAGGLVLVAGIMGARGRWRISVE